MMTWINLGLGGLVGAALSPFRSLPPIVGLSVVSLVAAIGMLLVFRATSNQPAIAAVKRRIHAGIFEIRLFNDDLRSMFSAQFDILRHNLTYLRLSLAPMVWMLVPLVLLIAQLQFYYGTTALGPGSLHDRQGSAEGSCEPLGGHWSRDRARSARRPSGRDTAGLDSL